MRFQAEHRNDRWQFDFTPSDLKRIDKPDRIEAGKGEPPLMLKIMHANTSSYGNAFTLNLATVGRLSAFLALSPSIDYGCDTIRPQICWQGL